MMDGTPLSLGVFLLQLMPLLQNRRLLRLPSVLESSHALL